MARCNLFRELQNSTGEFLMFSQFADDIAKQTTDGLSYRVSPSRFAALNISYGTNQKTDIPKAWQNYYENSIALVKHILDGRWNPQFANDLLWQFLVDNGWLALNNNNIYSQLKYVGDIPFYANRDEDNITYNEIYCHIPISAPCCEYSNSAQVDYEDYDASYDYTNTDLNQSYIVGWDNNTYPSNGITGGEAPSGTQYTLYGDSLQIPKILYKDTATDNSPDSQSNFEPTDDTSFDFNTIIVFYDIWDLSDATHPRILYSNIPLGVYYLGVDNNSIKSFTKIVSNDDAFGQGTSYGVRIMMRFSPAPNANTMISEVSTDIDAASLSVMMGQVGDLVRDLRSAISGPSDFYQSVKDHLAMFKNYRVNVPYIRLVGGTPTWFVNGRNTGYPAIASDPDDWSAVYSNLGIFSYDNSTLNGWDDLIPDQNQQNQIIINNNDIIGG